MNSNQIRKDIQDRIRKALPSRPPIFAHRGGSGLAPENTLAAFRNTIDLGFEGIEFDVQRTSDNELIVIHDRDLRRTTGLRGRIGGTTLSEIRKLNAGTGFDSKYSGERIPTLDETLEFLSDKPVRLIIELKHPEFYPGIEAQVIDRINAFSLRNRVQIASFNPASLSIVRGIDPAIPLVRNCRFELPEKNASYIASSVGARNLLLFPWRISSYRKRCKGLYVWKANTEKELLFFLSHGIGTIITDYPDRLKILLDLIYG